MMICRKILTGLLIVAFATSLNACGRKNKPIAPDSVEETYPRTYPAPKSIPSAQ